MRTIVMAGIAAACAAAPLAAQRAHQVELGGYGSFTRYDRVFQLDNQVGAGGRFGYFLSDHLSIELDGNYQGPSPKAGGTAAKFWLGGASVVLNFGGPRNLAYILGGYTQMSVGNSAPYNFDESAVHGAIGDRVFFGDHVALRLEARAVYAPKTNFPGGDWAGHVIGSVGLSFFSGGARFADSDADGIADRADACPTTPARATVDARGCPNDTDHDGVFNGLDACPNTPPSAQTDGTGCPLDGDHDAVFDGIDQCPGTPAGAQVDGRGCPTDADGDAVPDGVDRCPNTPAGAVVDSAGCPTDADKDGVADGIDRCPNTPAGSEVDTAGCQLAKDTDGDGVDDQKDRCPSTASGTRVDAAGCPILFTSERAPVVLRGVNFETGRSSLKPESFEVLDVVAASLIANPEIRIEIAGYTDNVGSAAVNVRLSQNRASAVRAYLAAKGVAVDRMQAKGYGSANPIATNTTAAGRAQNRRVELHKLP